MGQRLDDFRLLGRKGRQRIGAAIDGTGQGGHHKQESQCIGNEHE